MSAQGVESYEKAFRHNGLMYLETLTMIFDIQDGFKTADELGKPTTREHRSRVPQSPRLLIRHMDMATKLIDIVKGKKFLSDQDKATINFLPPVIQSGGFYQLDDKCVSDDNWFKDDIIIIRVGVEYGEYSSFVIRTVMFTPVDNQYLKKNYEFLLETEEFIMETLRDGIKLSDVYKSTWDFVRNYRPELRNHLTKCLGIVAQKREAEDCSIKADSKSVAKENMIFNISVGFEYIFDHSVIDRPPHNYALWIGDTVRVENGKKAKGLTNCVKTPNCVILKENRLL